MFKNKTILITGGTGSFGQKFTETILKKYTLHKKSSVLFSPCSDSIKASHLANLILKDRLKVRFQMQLHKILWGNEPGR